MLPVVGKLSGLQVTGSNGVCRGHDGLLALYPAVNSAQTVHHIVSRHAASHSGIPLDMKSFFDICVKYHQIVRIHM